jgi:hypothetical protein
MTPKLFDRIIKKLKPKTIDDFKKIISGLSAEELEQYIAKLEDQVNK